MHRQTDGQVQTNMTPQLLRSLGHKKKIGGGGVGQGIGGLGWWGGGGGWSKWFFYCESNFKIKKEQRGGGGRGDLQPTWKNVSHGTSPPSSFACTFYVTMKVFHALGKMHRCSEHSLSDRVLSDSSLNCIPCNIEYMGWLLYAFGTFVPNNCVTEHRFRARYLLENIRFFSRYIGQMDLLNTRKQRMAFFSWTFDFINTCLC